MHGYLCSIGAVFENRAFDLNGGPSSRQGDGVKIIEERVTDGKRAATLGQIGLWHFAPYLMNRIMGCYNASLRADLREQGLTVAQARALAVLSVADGVTINELSVLTVIEQSTMSRTLDVLEAQGLVRREPSQDDSRSRDIFLTQEGRAEFNRAWPAMRGEFDRMFAGVDEAEYAAFVTTLHKVLRNVRIDDF